MMIDQWFPLGVGHYIAGGLLIGFAVSLLFVATGLVGGMSSVYSSTLSYVSTVSFFKQRRLFESRNWRLVYALGLILGAALWLALSGNSAVVTAVPWWQLVIGGLIAGFGARLGDGCTSGHGICGVGLLKLPSFLAVLVFLSMAIITAQLVAVLS